MELLSELHIATVIIATLGITELIKDKWIFTKIKTRLLSFIITVILLTLSSFVSISNEALLTMNTILIGILPSLGFDYFYEPVIKPLIELFKKKK
jgi:uncharacterized membrane protein